MTRSVSPRIILALLIMTAGGTYGCRPVEPSNSPPEDRQLLEKMNSALEAGQNAEATEPVVMLPLPPPGWTRTERRPLPSEDHGFTVGYDHESGLAVTLYQFTRGLTSIPSGTQSPEVQEEMQHAKSGIEQAVALNLWKAARQIESRTVSLGNSSQQALWSRYELTSQQDEVLSSEIYIWARENTFFKLRCTCRLEDIAANQTILAPLLTAFGVSEIQTSPQPQ